LIVRSIDTSSKIASGMAADLPWVHVWGTGVDGLPPDIFTGRTVTCSRGTAAVPIAEFVLGAMLAFEKRLPEVWIDSPPTVWSTA
jgi:phosphoglycerate dehydrogenase-like enzyme